MNICPIPADSLTLQSTWVTCGTDKIFLLERVWAICPFICHEGMRGEVQLHAFLTSALDGGE